MHDDPDNPLLNRAIQAQFAPGSTFKPIVALAGLETGALEASTTFHCAGGATFYGQLSQVRRGARDHRSASRHRQILRRVFLQRGQPDRDRHHRAICDRWPGSARRPASICRARRKASCRRRAGSCATNARSGTPAKRSRSSIGQGDVTVTPIQLAVAIGGLAMGGVWHRPHLVKEEGTAEIPRQGDLHPENIATVVSGMCGVVNEGGTGASAQIAGLEVCGKTGTAQRISNDAREIQQGSGAGDEGQCLVRGFRSRRSIPRSWWSRCGKAGEHGALGCAHRARRHQGVFRQESPPGRNPQQQVALFRKPGAFDLNRQYRIALRWRATAASATSIGRC